VSTVGDERRVNTPRIGPYLEAIAAGEPAPARVEQLTADVRRRERLMLGLRLAEGVPRREVEGAVDDAALELLVRHGIVREPNGRIVLERRGRLLVHDVVARLTRDDR
jgi:oxygen-independent coproporphyrinogen-3 oxidase